MLNHAEQIITDSLKKKIVETRIVCLHICILIWGIRWKTNFDGPLGPISVGKTCSAHGGLAIYLNDEMNYKILNLYEQSNIWEGQFIEVRKLSSSKENL